MALATKLEDLNCIPGIYIVEEENKFLKAVFCWPHVYMHAHIHTCTKLNIIYMERERITALAIYT